MCVINVCEVGVVYNCVYNCICICVICCVYTGESFHITGFVVIKVLMELLKQLNKLFRSSAYLPPSNLFLLLINHYFV